MHIINVTIKRGNKDYHYTRLVQSYRGDNGKPTHRVLASFPQLSPLAAENLKTALAASRDGRSVVLCEETVAALSLPSITANLRYLDIALALSLWKQLRLPELLDSILPHEQSALSVADVTAALAIHRCVAPGSKLSAERWCPTTALPELLGFKPSAFNNTRIHRALETLEKVEGALQDRFPEHLQAQSGAFISLFLDVTNTHFVGHGPDFAHRGMLKDGRFERRIGIALLCDRRGLPLRWETLAGDYHDASATTAFIERIAKLPWATKAPLVVDRAMGQASFLLSLANSGVQFITALPAGEFASHTTCIPYQKLEPLKIAATKDSRRQDLKRVQAAAERAGLQKVRDDRYLLDLGVLEKGLGVERRVRRPKSARRNGPSRVVEAMRFALELGVGRDGGLAMFALSKRHQCSWATVRSHLEYLTLLPRLQERVLAGEIDGAPLGELAKLALLPAVQQEQAFDGLVASLHEQDTPRRLAPMSKEDAQLRLRYVVQFNPNRFIEQRRVADEQMREIDAAIADLNRRLRSPHSRRSEGSVRAEVDRLLRKRSLVSIFAVETKPSDETSSSYVVTLHRDEEAWSLRRRYDGFNVMVAHPEIQATAAEIVELYFAKDAVEKDFQTIKSVLDVRPIRHRTEPKVRAHVTLCILALLLERTLEQRLKAANQMTSAPTVFEVLSTCHLNQFAAPTGSVYAVTKLSDDQKAILGALSMLSIADPAAVTSQITPR